MRALQGPPVGESDSFRPSVPGLFLRASRPQGAATLTACPDGLLRVSVVRGRTLGSPLLAAVNTCSSREACLLVSGVREAGVPAQAAGGWEGF